MCAIEFLSEIVTKFQKLNSELKSIGVKVNISLTSGSFFYGYIGTNERINQVLINPKGNKIKEFLSTESFSEISVILSQEVYKQLHPDFQVFCYPYDIIDDIYYKIYCPEVNEPDFLMNLIGEESIIEQEYNLQSIIKKRESNQSLLYFSFDSVIDNIFMSNYIAQNNNTSIKSLAKLAFHYILLKDYKNVHEILDDICILFEEETSVDRDYFWKIKQYKDKAQQKLILSPKKP